MATKTEISEKRDALQKTIDQYYVTDTEIDDIYEKIIDITVIVFSTITLLDKLL